MGKSRGLAKTHQMNQETLVKQIEGYSNAIVAFAVLQGLAYAYAFGTDANFNCHVKTARFLAEGLTFLFVLVTALSIAATVALGRTMQKHSGDYREIVRKVYLGKCIVIIIFNLVPLALTFAYGVLDYPKKFDCA